MTTTSRLWAAVAKRVMAMVAGSGVAATTATSRLWAMAEERVMALAFNGGVAAMGLATAADGHRRGSGWWVFHANPTGMPHALHYTVDCTAAAV